MIPKSSTWVAILVAAVAAFATKGASAKHLEVEDRQVVSWFFSETPGAGVLNIFRLFM